jgi:large subunit ribosomal protein L15
MRLNTLKPAPGSRQKAKRVGRGIGSGLGKTCGRGHKGQHARAGGYHKVGFEGGQMPLQRRLPKFGFTSTTAADTDEIRLHELDRVEGDVVDMESLYRAGLLASGILRVRILGGSTVDRAFTVRGLYVTKGARAAIEAAGGKVEATA